MRLSFFDARAWRYVVSAISKVIEEGVFVIDEGGLKLRAMDPSHVVMVDMLFPPESFEEFSVKGRVEVGVNFDDLGKVLRRAAKDDKLVLEASEGKCSIVFEGKSVRRFVLPSLSLTAEELPEPRLEFKAKVRMLSDVFRDMVKDLEPIGDVVELVISERGLSAIAKSDVGEAEVTLSMESGSLLDLSVEEEARASYSLDYFSDMIAASQAADVVNLQLSSNMPVKVEYELPQGGRLAFYVAPRIE